LFFKDWLRNKLMIMLPCSPPSFESFWP
jgi:hypothetical protein